MVELFAAFGFAEGPRLRSKSRFRLSPGRKLPTPAELNGPCRPEPLGRDFHPLRRITASCGIKPTRFFPVAPFPRDLEQRRRQSGRLKCPSLWRHMPATGLPPGGSRLVGYVVLPSVETTTHLRAFSYRIEHRDYSHVPSSVAQGTQARITPMSLRRTGRATLMASGSTGQHHGGR